MMNRNAIEAVLGLVVLVVSGLFLMGGWQAGSAKVTQEGTQLEASFNNIDGLGNGAEIRLGGVKIGNVYDIQLDPMRYQAKLLLAIDPSVKIPEDSELKLMSDGLLGGKYLQLTAGEASTYLKTGERIHKTHDAVSLEDLMSRAIFLVSDNN